MCLRISHRLRGSGLLVLAALLPGCDRRVAPSTTASAPTTASASASSGASPAHPPSPCGDLPCTQYDSARDAFLAAAGGDPAVLAVGEAHAQRGSTAASAARRFTEEILPALTGRASDLLVELMMPPTGCNAATSEVRKKQEPATTKQAATNQNEYVTMGDRARALGIVPDLLRPTCSDMDAVRDAGDEAIDASLRLIARLCGVQAARLVDRDERSDADRAKAVIVYSGMLHNDLAPPPDRAAWSYAPALNARVGGRLVSIDLVVPEFIADDDTWRALPWVSHYDRARLGSKPTLIKTADRSYVLVFAETRPGEP
jgi:hypothetical protein